MSIHAQDKKFRLVGLPISYRDRPEGSESKLNTYQDGAGGLGTIVRLFREYRPMEFFGWLGLPCSGCAACPGCDCQKAQEAL